MRKWRLVLGLLASIAAVLILSVYGATSAWTKAYDAGLMATWVQAIGSVAAILAAIWIGDIQSRKARELLAHQSEQKIAGISAVLQSACSFLGELQDRIDTAHPRITFKSWHAHERDAMASVVASLEVLPLHELGDPGLVTNAAVIRSCCVMSLSEFDDAYARGLAEHPIGAYQGPHDQSEVLRKVAKRCGAAKAAWQAYKRFDEERRAAAHFTGP